MRPFGNFATADFHQIWIKRISVSHRGIHEDIFENFRFMGHLPPKSEIENRSNGHLTQSRLQVTGCTAEKYCLFHVIVQGSESFQDRLTFLCDVWLGSYGASKLPNFRILAYFPHTKPLKRTFRWPAAAQGLHSRMIPIFPCDSRRSRGVPCGTCVFLRLLLGELWTPKYWLNFAYWKYLYIDAMLLSYWITRSIWTKDGSKRHSQQQCVFCVCERCSHKFRESDLQKPNFLTHNITSVITAKFQV